MFKPGRDWRENPTIARKQKGKDDRSAKRGLRRHRGSIDAGMIRLKIAEDFITTLGGVSTPDTLLLALDAAKAAMGFDYVALTHHGDLAGAPQRLIRLHDYPPAWVASFDQRGLGPSDPVHRASHMTSIGFAWSELARLIPMARGDWAILDAARTHGIGEGFTVPAHVPGEANGSVSFAMAVGQSLPADMLAIVPLIATHAFECARRLWRMRPPPPPHPRLTPTQKACLTWVMRGKSDWETSQIMGCKPETVIRHIKQARERYGVDKRTLLLTRTLLDGTLSLADLAER